MIKEINSLEEFNEEVFDTDKLVVVDFHASWCEPCKEMLEVIDVVEKNLTDVKFLKVKVDDNRELARTFKIMSIPALLVFKNGERVDFTTGYKTEDAMEELVRKYL